MPAARMAVAGRRAATARRFSSVQVKIGVVIFSAVLVVAGLLTWRGSEATEAALIDGAETDLAQDASERSSLIEAGTVAAVADLRALRETPPVQGILRTEDAPDGIDPRTVRAPPRSGRHAWAPSFAAS